jgi:putative transposase
MYSNPQERAGRESESIAEMTLDEFDQYFCEYLVNDYHLKEHDGEGMKRRAPIQRWNDGIFRGDVMPARETCGRNPSPYFVPAHRKEGS